MVQRKSSSKVSPSFLNRLKEVRTARGLSQGELAARADITRQAISSIEANRYLPTTVVALQLARVLNTSVEDLFSLQSAGEVIEARLIDAPGSASSTGSLPRVKVVKVNGRYCARPVTGLGEVLSYTVAADGFLELQEASRRGRSSDVPVVRVRLSRDRQAIEQEIAVAGCDPAIFLAGEHLRRRKDQTSVVGWTMGSTAALQALQRGEVHVAGIHLTDDSTGESNLPFLRRHLKAGAYEVITFATWEEGLLVRPGNPKQVQTVADLLRGDVTVINREEGAGARLLLDQRLRAAGLVGSQVKGYERTAASHLHVARLVAEGQADVGVGIRSAAQSYGLDFIPLQSARYDLVVPKAYLSSHPSLNHLFDTLASRPFRSEIAAIGGYDTTDTGKLQAL
ncbi:MAG: substrate-binding domain-containing protein [Nitrospira sp.]|jgi:molybdate-binding protein/DNA-binding XRE family transcriptional regulator|nr:MAG: helix-turn-helix domain-containing protein [Nitrospira sp.]